MNLLSLLELGQLSSPALGHGSTWFSNLWPCIGSYTTGSPGSQVFKLRLNYTTGFSGSTACRLQMVGCLTV